MANDPLLGAMFQDYRVEKKLAQGGMGAVYLCRHVVLPNLQKVLKVISSDILNEPDQSASSSARASAERTRAFLLDRLEREAIAISRLHHRYIASIDGISDIEGRRCILMPFLEGMTLEQILRERGGQLTAHETLHVAAQIARALDYAHRRGIVHRDLKPGNVFIIPSEDDPLACKVIDFGIAKQLHARAGTIGSGPMGTPLFMAVEQFENPSEVTALADVYSLAVMIYLMNTGRYPWGEHHNAFVLFQRQLYDSPDPAPTLPPGWEDLLFASLSPDPRQRPQSMHALIYPLARSLPAMQSHKSGLEILRTVARRWAEPSPDDETIRGASSSAEWHAATSGTWLAATGSWPAVPSSPWPMGSSRTTAQESPLATAAPRNSSAMAVIPEAAAMKVPPTWKLALLAMAAAFLAGVTVFEFVRALERW